MDDNTNPLRTTPSLPPRSGGVVDVDWLAQQIRAVDGNNSLGAGALAEALLPRIRSTLAGPIPEAPADEEVGGVAEQLREHLKMKYMGSCKCGACQLVPIALIENTILALRRSTESDKPGRREAVLETVRAHKHTCANVQPGSTHADKCDCGALDTAGQVIPRSTTGGAK